MTAFTIYLILIPCSWLEDNFKFLIPPKFSFQLWLLALAAGHAGIALFLEEIVIGFVGKKADDGRMGKGKGKKDGEGGNRKMDWMEMDKDEVRSLYELCNSDDKFT
jgi:hypothetical protein